MCRYELLGLVVETSSSLSCAVSLENFRPFEKVKVWSRVAVWLSLSEDLMTTWWKWYHAALILRFTRWVSCTGGGFCLGEGGKKTPWSQPDFMWLSRMAVMVFYLCILLCSSRRIWIHDLILSSQQFCENGRPVSIWLSGARSLDQHRGLNWQSREYTQASWWPSVFPTATPMLWPLAVAHVTVHLLWIPYSLGQFWEVLLTSEPLDFLSSVSFLPDNRHTWRLQVDPVSGGLLHLCTVCH